MSEDFEGRRVSLTLTGHPLFDAFRGILEIFSAPWTVSGEDKKRDTIWYQLVPENELFRLSRWSFSVRFRWMTLASSDFSSVGSLLSETEIYNALCSFQQKVRPRLGIARQDVSHTFVGPVVAAGGWNVGPSQRVVVRSDLSHVVAAFHGAGDLRCSKLTGLTISSQNLKNRLGSLSWKPPE